MTDHPYPHLAPREESEERAKRRAEILKSILEAEEQGLYDVAEHYLGSTLGLRMLDEFFQIGDRVWYKKTGEHGTVYNLRPETFEEAIFAMENCGIKVSETETFKKGAKDFRSSPGCLIGWDDRNCGTDWVWKREVEKS
jgi:hypothetical protein